MKIEDVAKGLAAQVKTMLAERDAIITDLSARLKSLEERPAPKDGRDGVDGKDASPADLTPVYEILAARTEAIKNVCDRLSDIEGRPAPRDGRDGIQGQKGDTGERGYDGRDGNDGWSPDHVDMTMTDQGEWTFKMVTGDKEKSWSGRVPVCIDRGVYNDEATYLKGHVVSYGGDIWICREDNAGPPAKDFAGWRLAVRKGRDARGAKV